MMSKAQRYRPCTAGFSLIELLIVCSLMLLLISMLMPAVSLVQSQAEKIACSSNLRQVGLGLRGYAQENLGRYPSWQDSLQTVGTAQTHWGIWTYRVVSYLDGAWNRCPEVLICPRANWSRTSLSDQSYLQWQSYGMNIHAPRSWYNSQAVLGSSSHWAGYAINPLKIPNHSQTVLVSELWALNSDATGYASGWLDLNNRGYIYPPRRAVVANGWWNWAALRVSHQNRANVLNYDGRVDAALPRDLGQFDASNRLTSGSTGRLNGLY